MDDDILIDAGSGVTRLLLEQLVAIDYVFITHSHLDHILPLPLPLPLDSVGGMRDHPVTVYALDAVIEISSRCSWVRVPSPPCLPAITVPAVGYQLDSGAASLVFSGDTEPNPALWDWVNRIENLRTVIIETAFPQDEHGIAENSKYLSSDTLRTELTQLKRRADVYITHLKPGREQVIMDEIRGLTLLENPPKVLAEEDEFEL